MLRRVLGRATIFLLSVQLIFAVVDASTAGAQTASPAAIGIGQIRGRLTEATTGRAVAGGSVTVRRGTDTTFVGGALPAADGAFNVNGLPPGRYSVRIRVLGFAPIVRTNVVVSITQPAIELGVIALSPFVAQLAGQTVTAERADVTLAPDRNSYAVKNMTTASGGTAIDVLRNVPSVGVDGTNSVSLNGNTNVVVQINGRSSPLHGDDLGHFLAQLPASTISRVEVATNPSAKNDPEGTAGLINIVLSQDVNLGLSGGVTAGIGTTGTNASGNIGRQSGPWTLFTSYSVYHSDRPQSGSSALTNFVVPTPAFIDSRTDGSSTIRTQGLTVRSEYKLTPHDALSFDGTLSGGSIGGSNGTLYTNLDALRTVIGQFDQSSSKALHFWFQDYSVAYRRTGMPKAEDFSTELRYTSYGNTNDNALLATPVSADASTGATVPSEEHDASKWQVPTWSIKSDYTRNIAADTKLEAGLNASVAATVNGFTASYLDPISGQFLLDANRTDIFHYQQRLAAAYAVVSQKLGTVDAQAGLRLEQAYARLELPSPQQRYRDDYGSLFPSAILVYHLTGLRQVKLSYSRRITRPDPQQLSPVPFQSQPRLIFQGNPSLRPEYTDAVELGLQDTHSWGTLQVTPFVRRTAHAARYIQVVDSGGVTHGTFDNVASTLYAGSNINVTYHIGSISLLGGGSAYRFTSDAANILGNLSVHTFGWSARGNATWNFTSATDVQVSANYLAPSTMEGGIQRAYASMNLAFRHKLWSDKGSVTLRVADPFNMRFGVLTQNAQVSQLSERNYGLRGVFVTFSRNFGHQLKLRPRQDDAQAPAASPVGQ